MRVVLVNPSFQAHVRRIAQTTVGPPLGLAYLAGGLRLAGHNVQIVDANALGLAPEEAAAAALATRPDLLGVTATTPTLHLAAAIAAAAKRTRPELITVVGGPHATALPERTLRECPEFDYVAAGEAEQSFPALVTLLDAGDLDAAHQLRGFAWRAPDGAIHDTGLPEPLEDLDALPTPARDLLPMGRYRTVDSDTFTTMLAMRGCPCPCSYCAVPEMFGRRMRYRSPSAVAAEMEDVHRRFGVDFLSFVDDTFTTRRKWVLDLCDELERRGLSRRLRWVCLTRADMVDVDLLRRMRAAGCVRVEMSIESGSDTGRAYLRKGLTEAAILRGYHAAREAGLSTMGFLILNIPGETRQDILRSLDLALRADPDFLQVSFLTPYPGTRLRADAEANGWISTDNWADYSFLNAVVLDHKTLPPGELEALHAQITRTFWFRPRTAIKLARLVLNGTTRPVPLLRTIAVSLAASLGLHSPLTRHAGPAPRA
jgi:anaerobic magnesium-protoporphyrin IX monomethyl ester cyclase